ncbi:signal transduction histidine kinase [Bacillus sp. RC240]
MKILKVLYRILLIVFPVFLLIFSILNLSARAFGQPANFDYYLIWVLIFLLLIGYIVQFFSKYRIVGFIIILVSPIIIISCSVFFHQY